MRMTFKGCPYFLRIEIMYNNTNIKNCKNILPVLNATESKDFIERFNKNIITPEMLETCKKAAMLFHGENIRGKN